MSNVAADHKDFKSHPIFRPNQVLSDTHLNGMMEYLDNENRDTRKRLIGTGIMSGLDFRVATGLPDAQGGNTRTTITINNGKGITSAGHLIATDFETPGQYSYAMPYRLDTQKPQIPDLSEGTALYALIPDGMPGAESLDGRVAISQLDATKETGLVLMQEAQDIEVESCFVTSCDEYGDTRKFAIKALLIQLPSGPEAPNQREAVSPLTIKDVVLPLTNAPVFSEVYKEATDNNQLAKAQGHIDRINRILKAELAGQIDVSDIAASSKQLLDLRNDIMKEAPEQLQYFYDFLIDVKQGIDEVYTSRAALQHLFRPPENYNFPNHLVLGAFSTRGSKFSRHDFRPAPRDAKDLAGLQRLKELIIRLNLLVEYFSPLKKVNIVRVTPTKGRDASLGEQAISAYYDLPAQGPQLRDYWRPALGSTYLKWPILSYHNKELTDVLDEAEKSPLAYNHDATDYLLAEGIMEAMKSEALKQLDTLRRAHHLGFNLVALRVSSKDHKLPYPELPEDQHIREYNFKEFLEDNPSLRHGHRVPKGGTLAVVFEAEPDTTDGPVIATLMLPYICCHQPVIVVEPEPHVLNAIGDDRQTKANEYIDIEVLDNDEFDKNSTIEVDFVYDLDARDDAKTTKTGDVIDIKVLQNDQFDKGTPVDIDFVQELDANDVDTNTSTEKTIDINVLKNDKIGPGPVELDFDQKD